MGETPLPPPDTYSTPWEVHIRLTFSGSSRRPQVGSEKIESRKLK
jgi:hypothetical protein